MPGHPLDEVERFRQRGGQRAVPDRVRFGAVCDGGQPRDAFARVPRVVVVQILLAERCHGLARSADHLEGVDEDDLRQGMRSNTTSSADTPMLIPAIVRIDALQPSNARVAPFTLRAA